MVVRRAVLAEGVQGLRDDALAVGFDDVHERAFVDPSKVGEEFEGGERHADKSPPIACQIAPYASTTAMTLAPRLRTVAYEHRTEHVLIDS